MEEGEVCFTLQVEADWKQEQVEVIFVLEVYYRTVIDVYYGHIQLFGSTYVAACVGAAKLLGS